MGIGTRGTHFYIRYLIERGLLARTDDEGTQAFGDMSVSVEVAAGGWDILINMNNVRLS